MKMIKLHDVTGGAIYVNMSNVMHMDRHTSHTNLYFSKGYTVAIKETLEEIIELIR